MEVRWEGAPPVERIRAAVSSRLTGISVVAAHDLDGSNEVLISAEVPAEGDLAAMRQTIDQALSTVDHKYSIRSFEAIGPQIGADLRRQAAMATGGASAGMLLYLGWRFRMVYGVAAVTAMVHDAFMTIGLLSLLNQEISLTVVAALLTLVGYSMNDTIVIFDRIREMMKTKRREGLEKLANDAINQTLSRTIITSGLTFLTVCAMLVFGGEVLRSFSWCLFIGILIGTYSSIYIASPFMLWWEGWRAKARSTKIGTPAAVAATGATPSEGASAGASGVTPQMLAAAGVSTAPRKPRRKSK
jgi:preprotein translocase subunit SecF